MNLTCIDEDFVELIIGILTKHIVLNLLYVFFLFLINQLVHTLPAL